MDQIKNEIKAKLQTSIDSTLNDSIGQIKMIFGRVVNQFVDTLWPVLTQEFEKFFFEKFKTDAKMEKHFFDKQKAAKDAEKGQSETPIEGEKEAV
jgi:hypothetical protein